MTPALSYDAGACFAGNGSEQPEAVAREKAEKYFRRLSVQPQLSAYAKRFCNPQLAAYVAKSLATPGTAPDWRAGILFVDDPAGNVLPHNAGMPAAGENASLDLRRVRYHYQSGKLFLRFELAAAANLSDSNFWLQIYDNAGNKSLDLIFGDKSYANIYQNGQYVRTDALQNAQVSRAVRNGVEVFFDTARFNLPASFETTAVAYSQARNKVNTTRKFAISDIQFAAGTAPAALLVLIADHYEADTDSMLPMAVALAESFAYAHATPDVRSRIGADAGKMLRFATANGYVFTGYSFESLLAWANRGMMWGGLSGLYFDPQGRLNAEAYDFMYMNPEVLPAVKAAMAGILPPDATTTDAQALAIDSWALSKNRYRWKTEEICRWADVYPDHPDFRRICGEMRRDTPNDGLLFSVNGNPIHVWAIMGPNYQWNSIVKQGFYYGPCGDAAVVSMLALKALGIPDLGLYRRLGPTDDFTHTFTAYYDVKGKKWKVPASQQPPSNQVVPFRRPYLQWSLPVSSPVMPTWEKKEFSDAAVFWVNERSPVEALTWAELQKKLKTGFTDKELRTRVLNALRER